MGKHMKVRLPFEYNLKEQKKAVFEAAKEKRARELFKEYNAYAIDMTMMANFLALIECEGWGTGKRATRIYRHSANVEKIITDACERYDYAFAMTALQKRLREYGVEYEGRGGKGEKS